MSLGWRTFITTCLGAPWKVSLCFYFLFRNQWSLLLNIQRLLIVSWLQSFIRLKTTLTPRPSPFFGPDSTPNSSASIKFFQYVSKCWSKFQTILFSSKWFLSKVLLLSYYACLCFLSMILTTTLTISPRQSRPPTRSLPSTLLCELLPSYFLWRFCRLFILSMDNSVCFFNIKWLTGWSNVKCKCDFQKIQIENNNGYGAKVAHTLKEWLFVKKNDQM